MKKRLDKKTLNTLAGALAVAVVVWLLLNAFDVGTRWRIHQAIGNLVNRRDVEKARTALENAGNRAMVIERLKAELEDDHPSVWGKIELLNTLARLKEVRPIERALDSKTPATRRAAAYFYTDNPERKEWAGQIAEEWVAESEAHDRDLAAMICGRLKRSAAAPHLFALLDANPRDPANAPALQQALYALAELKAAGLATRAMALARSPEVDMTIRAQAFDIAARLDDAPHEELRALMLSIAQDGGAAPFLRDRAIHVLGGEKFADEEVWTALQGILFDPKLTEPRADTESRRAEQWVVQRFALGSLGRTYPLDRLAQLMLDRRLHTHPYYAIRVDVATALSVLRVRNRLALEILCSFLVNEDSRDSQLLTRQEGWLSLWQLTGTAYGVSDPKAFGNPSAPIRDEQFARRYLFNGSASRLGVTMAQIDAVKAVTGDLAQMKKIRQTYESNFDKFEAAWKAQDEAKPPAPPGGAEEAPQGPMPPGPEKEGEGSGEGAEDG